MTIESGELNSEHYQSYLKLKAESEFNEVSYVDKRKKGRAFGKHVKSVLKEKGAGANRKANWSASR
jgi:ribosome biogenesis GTPase